MKDTNLFQRLKIAGWGLKAAFKEEKNRLPEISLFAPRIYFNAVPSKEEIDEIEKVMPLFKAHEWFAGQLVGLQLMDVKHFSLLER